MTVEFYAEGQFDDADSEDEGPLGEEEKQAYLMELINTSLSSKLGRIGRDENAFEIKGFFIFCLLFVNFFLLIYYFIQQFFI